MNEQNGHVTVFSCKYLSGCFQPKFNTLTGSGDILRVDGGGSGFKRAGAQDVVSAEGQSVDPVGVALQGPAHDALHAALEEA